MNKDNILFGVIGLLLGLIIGFVFANNINQRGPTAVFTPGAQQQPNQALPPDHPAVPGGGGAGGAQGGPDMQAVQEAINLAKTETNNFDAQMKAADYTYQIQRYDDAIQFLTRANQLKPDSYEAVVNLGNVNFDAGRYQEAEKWYTAALKTKPDDVNVRTDLGLTFYFRTPPDVDRAIKEYRASLAIDPNHVQTLQNLVVALTKKGDAAEARAALTKLEGVSPNNPAVARLRSDLEALGTAK
ncbi:MAG TPA: tetratricopeptide repeat protein [Pyrinomonadaceae bacterium]|nr:tetratricopeptide repeat protein [Pyrinomonadaceae bacterium]